MLRSPGPADTSGEEAPQDNIPAALHMGLLGASHAFIDRVELRVRGTRSTQGEAWLRYTADPARYLPVPSVPQAELVAACAAILDEHLKVEERSALAHHPDWQNALQTRLPAEALQRVRWAVTRHLVGHLRVWLAEQRLPEVPFLRPALAQTPWRPAYTIPSARPSGDPADLWIQDPELLRALVVDRDDQAPWMHLGTFRVAWATEGQDGPGPPVGEAEWGWVRLPRLSTEEQLGFVQSCLTGRLNSTQLERVCAQGKHWSEALEKVLARPDWEAFQHARRRWIADRLRTWLVAHRMPSERFLAPYRPNRPARGARAVSAPAGPSPHLPREDRTSALRERLHQALDRMTWEELSALPIPARLLLEADPE